MYYSLAQEKKTLKKGKSDGIDCIALVVPKQLMKTL